MTPNRKAFIILSLLVLTSLAIFCVEQKFLVAEPRGATVGNYKGIAGAEKIILLVEDFEEVTTENLVSPKENFFSYGSAKISIDHSQIDSSPLSLKSALKVEWTGTDAYGGWGKGVGTNIDLDTLTDYLNFRVYFPGGNLKEDNIKIILEEDDNDDGTLQKDKDDAWFHIVNITAENKWQTVSIPLKDFKDDNEGGDHKFNVTRKGGLHTLIFSFQNPDKYAAGQKWFFDFVYFSRGKINTEAINN